ncbi:MAG: AIR synthase related protein [Promethearchaeota archaeon]
MLEKIVDSIRNNENILEKKGLAPIIDFVDVNSFKNLTRIHSDIGEDSAAINFNESYILVTTDRIRTDFIENFPYGAGFSAILVSIDDIYACGGFPLAASLIISYEDEDKGKKILEGICDASKKFHVPIIRGHTKARGKTYELSSTVIGEIKKNDYISARNAQVNDKIILAVDFEGKVGKASRYYFDTTTFKNSENVLRKRKAMNIIAQSHLAHSSKDISNSGIFGTILQLIQYSGVGANININKIVIPPILKELDYTIEIYTKMYLTTSFILTAPEKNCEKILEIFKDYGLNASIIGKIIKNKNLLRLNEGNENKSVDVIKF